MNAHPPRLAARLSLAGAAAGASALLVAAAEVVALALAGDRPILPPGVIARFAAGTFAVAFATVLGPAVLAAAWLARPYALVVERVRRAARPGLWAAGVGGVAALAAGALFLMTLKKLTPANLGVAGAAAAGVGLLAAIVTPAMARHVDAALSGGPAPLSGRVVVGGLFAVCFGAGRFTLRGDYTALHQLYAAGALVTAALLALPVAARLTFRGRVGLAVAGASLLAAAPWVLGESQVARQALHHRTGVAQYLLIGATSLRPPPPVPPDPAGAPRPAPFLPTPRDSTAPDVLWIMIDTLRADRLGAGADGSTLTPNLDAFAREAVVFPNAWSQATNTVPSVASFLTGRHPALRAPDVMHRHVDAPRDEPFFLPAPYRAHMASRPYFDLAVRRVLAPGAIAVLPADRGLGDDADTVDNLLRLLRESPLPSPSFLWMTFEGPHARGDVSRRAAYVPYPALRATYARDYDEAVRRVDAQFGRLWAGLRALGRVDESLVVVFADHGEALGEHGDLFHAKEVREATQRVPLLVRLPGGAHAGVMDVTAELVDLVPTTLDFVGLAPHRPISGKSLLPFITGQAPAPAVEEAWSQSVYMRRKVVALVRRERGAPRFKAIHDVTFDVTELYDLDADPGEVHDLADADPSRAAAMRDRIRARLAAEGEPVFFPMTQP